MKYNPEIHHRRSIRLKGYDYSQAGHYFLTICTKDRHCVFGTITDGTVQLSERGAIVAHCWTEMPTHFGNAVIDEYVVMPNHVHGIVRLFDPGGTRHADPYRESNSSKGFIHETPSRKGLMNQTPTRKTSCGRPLMEDPRASLGKLVRAFKAKTSKLIHNTGYGDFEWQRNYYDHIIRDGGELDRIRQYIVDNPTIWKDDENFPKNIRMEDIHRQSEHWSVLD